MSFTQWLTRSAPTVLWRLSAKAIFSLVPTPSALATRTESLGRPASEKNPPNAPTSFNRRVLKDVGAFGGFFSLAGLPKDSVLVASADGVGTKLKIAFALNRHNTVGADLVNHCVNDIAVHGATPLFFLDYLATGKLRPPMVAEILSGLARACRASGCALIGGETAE